MRVTSKSRFKIMALFMLAMLIITNIVPVNAFAETYKYVGYRYNNEYIVYLNTLPNTFPYDPNKDCEIIIKDENNDQVDKEIAYCFNEYKYDPTSIEYYKTYENATDADFWNSATNPNVSTSTNTLENAQKYFKNTVLWIVKLGYPYKEGRYENYAINDLQINASYLDSALRVATQYAIWNMTDRANLDDLYNTAKGTTYNSQNLANIFLLAKKIQSDAWANRENAPENMGLDIYTPVDTSRQNLLATRRNTENKPVGSTEPTIKTSASFKDKGDKSIEAKGEITIIDTVTYENLEIGKEYVLEAKLMETTTKAAIVSGAAITGELKFTPTAKAGSVDVKLVIPDAAGLLGDYVVYEILKLGDFVVASHKQFDSEEQTVTFNKPTPGPGSGTTPTPGPGSGTTPTPGPGSGTTPTPGPGSGTTPTPGPGSGTTPTEPTEPVEPTEPTEPVEPTEPTEPVEPTEPTEPVEPTEPKDKYTTTDDGPTPEEIEETIGKITDDGHIIDKNTGKKIKIEKGFTIEINRDGNDEVWTIVELEEEELPGGGYEYKITWNKVSTGTTLPFTGGVTAEIIYGLGALVMMSGIAVGKKKKK